LKFVAQDGKMRETDYIEILFEIKEGIFQETENV
jgi:hypothetical protein